jgi:hypothetical protein
LLTNGVKSQTLHYRASEISVCARNEWRDSTGALPSDTLCVSDSERLAQLSDADGLWKILKSSTGHIGAD